MFGVTPVDPSSAYLGSMRSSILALIGSIALTAGCGLLNPDGSTLAVTYRSSPPFNDPALLHLDVDWPGASRHIAGLGFSGSLLSGARFESDVGHVGMLHVRLTLVAAPADTLGVAVVTLYLADETSHFVNFQAGGRRPTPSLFCTSDQPSVPLRRPGQAAVTDTLFLDAGGLQDGSVC